MDMERYLIYIFTLFTIIISTKQGVGSTKSDISFHFVILADPQAWRIYFDEIHDDEGNDWGKQGEEWMKRNRHVVRLIDSLHPKPLLHIVNGDITEYGRLQQWSSFDLVYGNLSNVYIGLGNHDYQNNVHKCWDLLANIGELLGEVVIPEILKENVSFRFGEDTCAIQSLFKMEERALNYKRYLRRSNFRLDIAFRQHAFEENRGSLSYSWDQNRLVHFVQLQNYPTYKELLKEMILIPIIIPFMPGWMLIPIWYPRYQTSRSVTWLGEDLKLARKRGVKDIIINFHQIQGLNKDKSEHDKRQFLAIMETYKPLAIFAGHQHIFGKPTEYTNLFGDTPVYETGAAFFETFHLVYYNDGSLIISEMNATAKETTQQVYTQDRPAQNPTCIIGQDALAPRGAIFTSSFLPKEGTYWNIYHYKKSKKYLDSSGIGEVYMTDSGPYNKYLRWSFEKVILDEYEEEFEFWADYQIRNLGTGRVLVCDEDGNLFTISASISNKATYWRIMKTKDNEVMFVHTETDLFLDSTDDGKVRALPRYNAQNPYKAWEIVDSRTNEVCGNVRFFKALSSKSGTFPIPTNNQSNKYYEFLGYHHYLNSSPCVGW